jgi:hypothetical protein
MGLRKTDLLLPTPPCDLCKPCLNAWVHLRFFNFKDFFFSDQKSSSWGQSSHLNHRLGSLPFQETRLQIAGYSKTRQSQAQRTELHKAMVRVALCASRSDPCLLQKNLKVRYQIQLGAPQRNEWPAALWQPTTLNSVILGVILKQQNFRLARNWSCDAQGLKSKLWIWLLISPLNTLLSI